MPQDSNLVPVQAAPVSPQRQMDVGIWIDPIMLEHEAAFVRHLIMGLKGDGQQVTIIAEAEMDLSALPTLGSRTVTYRHTLLDRGFMGVRRKSPLAQQLANDPPDVLLAWGAAPPAPLATLQQSVHLPMVIWCWEVPEFSTPLARLPTARHIVASSHNLAERAGNSPLPVTIIPPGVYTDEVWSAHDCPDQPPCLVCLDALSDIKSYGPMLQACARLSEAGHDFLFFAFDTGKDEHAIWKFAEKLKLLDRITFVPYRHNAENLLLNADFYVHVIPDNRFEYRTLEAMARGLTIVSRPNMAADYLLDQQTCRIVPDAGAEAWHQVLLDLLTDRVRAVQLGRRGQQMMRERHGITNMITQVTGICRQSAGIPIPLTG